MRNTTILPLLLAVAAALALDACADSTAPVPQRIAASARRETPNPATAQTKSAQLFGGRAADSALRAIAATWAKGGVRSLADHIASRDAKRTPLRSEDLTAGDEGAELDRPRAVSGAITAPSGSISPSTRPYAYITSSGTSVFLNGTSGVVYSSVIYYGNMARSDVSYSVTYSDGAYPPVSARQSHQEEGTPYPCYGDAFVCSFTFDLETVIQIGLSRDCGVTLQASASHEVWWQVPGIGGYVSGARWGNAFAVNPPASRSSAACAPPQTSSTCRATTTNTTLFSPTLDPGGIAVPCNQPSGGSIGNGVTCTQQYVYIEMRSNGVWQVIWQGWMNVCS